MAKMSATNAEKHQDVVVKSRLPGRESPMSRGNPRRDDSGSGSGPDGQKEEERRREETWFGRRHLRLPRGSVGTVAPDLPKMALKLRRGSADSYDVDYRSKEDQWWVLFCKQTMAGAKIVV